MPFMGGANAPLDEDSVVRPLRQGRPETGARAGTPYVAMCQPPLIWMVWPVM